MKRPFRNHGSFKFRKKLSVNSALTRQSKALESHEAKIANHTALQSYVAIITTVVSFLTAVALGYISYLQYKTSSRQVELDYAKIAPQWELNVETRYPRGHGNISLSGNWDYYPISATLALQRGEARVNRVSVFQDMQVARVTTIHGMNNVQICIARFDNYFTWTGNGLKLSTSQKALQIADVPLREIRHGKNISRDHIIFTPKDTWVKIGFVDLFGKSREITLHRDDKTSSIAPNGMPETDDVWPITSARFDENKSMNTESILSQYTIPTKFRECENIYKPMIISKK